MVASMSLEVVEQLMSVAPGERAAHMSRRCAYELEEGAWTFPASVPG